MIVTCPNCSTRFLVDNNALGERGRTVRCANCKHTWHQAPPERETVAPPAEATAPAAPAASSPAASAEGGSKRGAKARGGRPSLPSFNLSWKKAAVWLAAVAVVAGLAGSAITMRESISAAWPPAARFYALIGMPVPALGEGLAIQDTSLYRQQRGNRQRLVVEGIVRNTGDSIQEVPTIRISLLDGQQRRLNWRTLTAPDGRLLPGETTTFDTAIQNPHPAAVSAQVTFTRDKAGMRYHPEMDKPERVGEGGDSSSDGDGDGDG